MSVTCRLHVSYTSVTRAPQIIQTSYTDFWPLHPKNSRAAAGGAGSHPHDTARKLGLCSRALRSSTSFARSAPWSFITAERWPSAFQRRTKAWMSTSWKPGEVKATQQACLLGSCNGYVTAIRPRYSKELHRLSDLSQTAERGLTRPRLHLWCERGERVQDAAPTY